MSLKMPPSGRIGIAGFRLADIMQKHGESEQRIAFYLSHRTRDMAVNVKAVVRSSLFKVKAGRELRDYLSNYFTVICKYLFSRFAAYDTDKLFPDSFPGDVVQ